MKIRWKLLILLLAQCADKPAGEIHAAIVAAVKDFRAAEPQKDDVTAVVIKAV